MYSQSICSKKCSTDDIKVVNHIGLIMDGNGRWAKSKGKKRNYGHKEGCKRILEVADAAIEFGVKAITLYAFSTENWNRPNEEVSYIMKLVEDYFASNKGEMNKKQIKFNFIGNIEDVKIKPRIRELFKNLKEETKNNEKLVLTVAFNYGAKEELLQAIKSLYKDLQKDNINIENINFDDIESRLYTKGLPPLDLVIRTSGEQRLSNFLLLQGAYSELYFTDVHWPDFKREELKKAIDSFNGRNRRFGGV